jgi:hypothetical protein
VCGVVGTVRPRVRPTEPLFPEDGGILDDGDGQRRNRVARHDGFDGRPNAIEVGSGWGSTYVACRGDGTSQLQHDRSDDTEVHISSRKSR